MPPINHVIIFGDSLSDIGRKAKTIMGKAALAMGEMTINMTNRFSDCRNWTDFMFEDASGSSLITENHSDTIKASAAYHRLKRNWVTPPGAPRFRYANYAMGGAVGGSIKTWLAPGVGLTSFEDQVEEFKEDYAKLTLSEKQGANFLFIVMFGANDIYTDQIKTGPEQTDDIANTIIYNCIETIRIIKPEKNNPNQQIDYHFMIMGVAKPYQSRRYTLELENQKTAVTDLEERLIKSQQRITPIEELIQSGPPEKTIDIRNQLNKAKLKLNETKTEHARMLSVADALNDKLKTLVDRAFKDGLFSVSSFTRTRTDFTPGRATFFSMEKCLRSLEAPFIGPVLKGAKRNVAGGLGIISNASQTVKYKDIHVTPNNYAQQVAGNNQATFFFTVDDAHPTSRAYAYLWTKIKEVLEKSGKTFGLLASAEASIPKAYNELADKKMKDLLGDGLAQYKKEISSIFASQSKPSKAAAEWLGKQNFTFNISQGKATSGRVWPYVEVPVFVAVMYLLVVNNAQEAPPRPDDAPERLNSQTTRLGKILQAQVLNFVKTNEGKLYKEFIFEA